MCQVCCLRKVLNVPYSSEGISVVYKTAKGHAGMSLFSESGKNSANESAFCKHFEHV